MNAYQVHYIGRPLEKGDIKDILGKSGSPPAVVALCRFNERFKAEVPDNVKIDIRGGLLRSEIWIADQEVYPENRWHEVNAGIALPIISETPLNGSPVVSIINDEIPEVRRSRGRPRISGAGMSRTTRWRRLKEAVKTKTEQLI